MQSFKQYLLKEDNSTHYPWQAKSNEELLELPGYRSFKSQRVGGEDYVGFPDNFNNCYFGGFFDNNGYLIPYYSHRIADELLVEHDGKWYLPANIKHWQHGLILNSLKLSSFLGFPDEIEGNLEVLYCPNLTLEGCPSIIKGNVVWHSMPITNRMDKVFKQVNGYIVVPPNYKGFLSFLKIKNLEDIVLSSLTKKDEVENFKQAKKIIFEYIKNGNNDAIACQRELIEKDLDEYAEF
jgi:hypothetical protein